MSSSFSKESIWEIIFCDLASVRFHTLIVAEPRSEVMHHVQEVESHEWVLSFHHERRGDTVSAFAK